MPLNILERNEILPYCFQFLILFQSGMYPPEPILSNLIFNPFPDHADEVFGLNVNKIILQWACLIVKNAKVLANKSLSFRICRCTFDKSHSVKMKMFLNRKKVN